MNITSFTFLRCFHRKVTNRRCEVRRADAPRVSVHRTLSDAKTPFEDVMWMKNLPFDINRRES